MVKWSLACKNERCICPGTARNYVVHDLTIGNRWVCMIQGRIHGRGEGGNRPSPRLDGCRPKNRDARPIKSSFNQSQNALKIAFWSSKIEKCSAEGAQPPSQTPTRWGNPFPTPHPSAPRSSRLRRSTRLVPNLPRRLGHRLLHSPLATPSGSAPSMI